MAANHGERQNDDALLYGALVLILAAMIVGFWYLMHAKIVFYTLAVADMLLEFISFLPLSAILTPIKEQLEVGIYYADQVPFLEYLRLSAMGYIIYSPIVIIWAFFEFLKTLNTPKEATKRAMSLDRLRRIMNSHSTATIPLNGYPNLLQSDAPGHESGLSPLEFVKKHDLVHRRILNKKLATKVFEQQLGEKIGTVKGFKPHEKALFAVFASRLFGDNREESQTMLDALNRSSGKTGYPDFSIIEESFQKYADNENTSEWLNHHKYKPTLLYAMHREAVKFGKLPSSYFRWLKGIDRTLWYTLNNSGRKVGWSECAGVYSQAEWEIFAKSRNGSLEGHHVTPAVEALEKWLVDVGAIVKPISGGE